MPRSRRHRRAVAQAPRGRYGQHAFEPIWRADRHLFGNTIPEQIAFWLFDDSSLTARILEACDGPFRVEVISQGWQVPMLNEAQYLHSKPVRRALVRQVYLYCNDRPWVFARTVIPAATLRGKERHLAHLNDKPLGAVLFAEPSMRRGEVEVAAITPGQRLYDTATQHLVEPPACIWGRRSLFYLHDKPLLVNEIFLPEIYGHGAA